MDAWKGSGRLRAKNINFVVVFSLWLRTISLTTTWRCIIIIIIIIMFVYYYVSPEKCTINMQLKFLWDGQKLVWVRKWLQSDAVRRAAVQRLNVRPIAVFFGRRLISCERWSPKALSRVLRLSGFCHKIRQSSLRRRLTDWQLILAEAEWSANSPPGNNHIGHLFTLFPVDAM